MYYTNRGSGKTRHSQIDNLALGKYDGNETGISKMSLNCVRGGDDSP